MLLLLAALLLDDPKPGPVPPAVTVRLAKPREQGERLLRLFDGARAPSPAAALAGYKRAKGGDTGLGKPIDAAIACLNPQMVAELAVLDGTTFALGWSENGRASWDVVIPRDDGTFAAYATAGMLTEGARMPPLDGIPVDRLGPKPTAAQAARAPGGFLLGSSREELTAALLRSREPLAKSPDAGGWVVHVDPKALSRPEAPLPARRVGVALGRFGATGLDAEFRLDGETLHADLTGTFAAPPAFSKATIRPEWLDGTPNEGVAAAFAVALDPSPAAWRATFDALDAVDRVDPARANLAPLRLRVNLMASGLGFRPDVELWPVLVGISGFVTVDASGKVDGWLVRLHARDAAAAERLRAVTLRHVAEALARRKAAAGDEAVAFEIQGRRVDVERRGADVLLAWGEGTLAKAKAKEAANPGLRGLAGPRSQRFVASWPGRLPGLALPEAPPVVWVGSFDGATSRDAIRWPGLKPVVRRVLDRIPFDPPPDRSTPSHRSS